ncbi:hypothetical protein [uncultured Algoriphagus sp.]|uniref:hypothetical protein n=1 Tax=uncultured Algoriphagus sp. TaxID=417365 RepID=UPI0030ED6CB8|tara:strand:- start:1207 stop:1722 length:516 start_codon:yes stop_codon:yes gene_type:complete
MTEDFDLFDKDFENESKEQKEREKHQEKQYEKFKGLGVEGIQNINPVWATGKFMDQNMMNRLEPNGSYAHIQVSTIGLIEEVDFGELNPKILFSGDMASDMRFVTTLDRWEGGLPVDPPELGIDINNGKINFKVSDGRHRAILAFHLGEDCIPVYVHKSNIEHIKILVKTC